MCGRANGQGSGIHLANDNPCDATNAARRWVGELVEGRGREVEVAVLASPTPVGQLDVDGVALVRNPGSLAADRVLVRVPVTATEGIEEFVRDGSDHIAVVVGDTASTKTGGVEGSLTRVSLTSAVTRVRS